MPADGPHMFTDREEEVALFEAFLGSNPDGSWPLLPILAFIAPGGSGKSTLIKHLIDEKCSVDGRPVIPYARLDFTPGRGAPTELLSILIRLRDELQRQPDRDGHHLSFPRFDLGALVAQAPSSIEDLAALVPDEIRKKLDNGTQLLASLGTLGTSLVTTLPVIGPLVAALKLAQQLPVLFPAVNGFLVSLEKHTGWTWYRQHGTVMGLRAEATMKEVLDRLQVLSLPGTPERDELVSEQLPAAFMADLSAALVTAHHREAWPSTANVVIFLEGFEGLERTSRETATRLLQGLTTQQRQQGRTDPLLLVVASRDPLLEVEEERAAVPFARTDEDAAQQRANSVLKDWKQRAAAAEGSLGLSDLYLPLRLHDFGREETRTYLEQFGERRHTRAFAESLQLVETIDQFTHGHPLFLALAAETVLAAKKGGPQLLPSDFERDTVSPAIDPAHSRDQIGAYLVARFLRQLSEEERNDLISCAIPRFVDRKLLRVLLPVLDDRAASKRWDNYRRLSFMTADPVDVERSLFHPVVRQELLNEWPDKDNPASDYSQSHARLRDHFKKRASLGDDRAAVEEAYHALALGDPEPAITVGIRGQRSNLPLWDSLMEAVRQAPTEQLPSHIRGQTDAALTRVRQFPLEDAVRTIVLDTWLLSAPGGDPKGRGDLQRQLGEAYYSLPGGDLGENRRQGVRHLEAALEIFNPEAFPAERARTQSSLGAAYLALWMSSTHDRDVYWGKAISCIQAAAQAFKPVQVDGTMRIASFNDWFNAVTNLGTLYQSLPGGDREANLRQAIGHYEAVSQVDTLGAHVTLREASPVEWSTTHTNLGNAYRDLPTGDREANLRQAIGHYEAALQIDTREASTAEWATIQMSLGNSYSELPTGDRADNLRNAISCYEAAATVFLEHSFLVEWAGAQSSLGMAYSQLPTGDRATNLGKVIACYEAALRVYTREANTYPWTAAAQNNLGAAYTELPTGDPAANLRKAIACYEAAFQGFSSLRMDGYAQAATSNLKVVKDALERLDQPPQPGPEMV